MSLRLRLIATLAVLLTLVALGAAIHAFRAAAGEADAFLDRQQQQMARYVGDLSFVSAEAAGVPQTESEDDYVVVVRYLDDRPMLSSHPAIVLPETERTGFSNFEDADGPWRLFTLALPERTIRIAQRMEVRGEIAEDGAWNAALPILLSIPLTWLVLVLVTKVAFRPLERAAREVAKRESVDMRPIDTVSVPPEVRPLVAAINDLLARVERALQQQKDFIGEAAHALRTPIAALTLQIDNLRTVATDPRLVERLNELKDGARRTSALAQQLLVLARVDARQDRTIAAASLDAVVTQVIADLAPKASNRQIDLGFRLCEHAEIQMSPHDLRLLADILIDNAIRHTPAGGVVDVSVASDACGAFLSVSDTGPGIPDELIPRVFERFFRANTADEEGSGLGLAIAASIARKYGVVLELRNRPDRSGLTALARFDGPDQARL